MTGPAVQAGSALGGFIEGVTGGFERTTEFRRRRRIEQQVAEQIRNQTARQGRQDAREDLNLFLNQGIIRTPTAGPAQEVPEPVSNLRRATGPIVADAGAQGLPRQGGSPVPTQQPGADPRAVGANLIGQDAPQSVDPTDAILASLGFRQVVDGPPKRSFTVDVGGVETVAGTEEEALRLQGAFTPPEQPTPRNIDPLSPEGIRAGAERERIFLEIRERARGARIDDRTSEALLRTANQLHQQTLRRFDTDSSPAAIAARLNGTAVEPDFNDSYNEAVRRFALNQSITQEQARTLGVDVSNDADQAGGLDESETTEAKRLVQGLPRQEQEEELAAAGYTADEIKRILNGR